jgi:hypothetical protein
MNTRITRSPAIYRNAAFLASCGEDAAVAWLRDRPVTINSVSGTVDTPNDAHILEYVLFRRRSAAIDLAMAEYGRSKTILRRVYRRSSDAVRVTACSNASLFVGDTFASFWRHDENLLWDIIFDGPLAQLRAICENPGISSGFYGALIGAWQPEDDRKEDKRYLPEDRYIAVLNFLSANPRISQSREESTERHYMDGYAENQYDEFYAAAWELAEKAPVRPDWASALAKLFNKLYAPWDCIKDIEGVLDRWRPADEGEYAATRDVREAVAARFMEPSLEQLYNADSSIRQAFYQTFDPDAKEFRDVDWNEWIDRDPQIYFDISVNDKVWASARGRSNLNGMLWHGSEKDSDLVTIGFYKERIEELQAGHPEWFADEDRDEDNYVEPMPDPIVGLRQEIRELVALMVAKRNNAIQAALAAIAGIIVGVLIK